MAVIKPLSEIQPYIPADVPILAKGIPPALSQFLADEFKRISYPLQVLSDDWEPNFQIVMRGPTLPTTWDSTRRTVADYSASVASKEIYTSGAVVDQATGVITFVSDPSVFFLARISGSINVAIDNGDKDETSFLYANVDGVDVLIDTVFIANKMDFLSLSGVFFGALNGASSVSLRVECSGNIDVTILTSSLFLEVVAIIDA